MNATKKTQMKVGTPVEVLKDNGVIFISEVATEPWLLLDNKTWVVGIEGIVGGYSLDRVTAIEPTIADDVLSATEKAQGKDDGGSAYPSNCCRTIDCPGVYIDGMTLRDYFAGQAMQALIAKAKFIDREGEHGEKMTQEAILQFKEEIADSAYWYADCMIAQRKK